MKQWRVSAPHRHN